jgi:hypothetical protein
MQKKLDHTIEDITFVYLAWDTWFAFVELLKKMDKCLS